MRADSDPAASGAAATLSISVIVPVFNNSGMLAACLAAIAASDLQPRECLVADDGSTEDIGQVARAFQARVCRVGDDPQGPAFARNAGAAAATGDILLFIDADVVIRPGTLRQFAEVFSSQPAVDAVFGSYDDAPATPDLVSQFKNLFHHFVHQQASEEAGTFWSGCGAVRRAVFLASGGFDAKRYPRPCIEDIELGSRLRAAGHRILLDRRIEVKHLKRWTLGGLIRTDIFDRGVPWTRLILESQHLPNDLNLRVIQRVSALLAAAMWLYMGVMVFAHGGVLHAVGVGAGIVSLSLVAIAPLLLATALIVVLNYPLYVFFVQRRGVLFALAAVPMHLLYFSCTLAALTIGVLAFLAGGRRSHIQAAGPVRREGAQK